jgi:hypothetical protein
MSLIVFCIIFLSNGSHRHKFSVIWQLSKSIPFDSRDKLATNASKPLCVILIRGSTERLKRTRQTNWREDNERKSFKFEIFTE